MGIECGAQEGEVWVFLQDLGVCLEKKDLLCETRGFKQILRDV